MPMSLVSDYLQVVNIPRVGYLYYMVSVYKYMYNCLSVFIPLLDTNYPYVVYCWMFLNSVVELSMYLNRRTAKVHL